MPISREILLTRAMLFFTAFAAVMALVEIAAIGADLAAARDWTGVASQVLFALAFVVLAYGFFVYLLTRIGQLDRRHAHSPAGSEDLETVFTGDAGALAILIPSYKEEPAIVRRTLLSAALQAYPRRRVVLLIDDPCRPDGPGDAANLAIMRGMPSALQAIFDAAGAGCRQADADFRGRFASGAVDPAHEAATLARLNGEAANWFEREIDRYPVRDHGDRLFVTGVLVRCRDDHRRRAQRYALIGSGRALTLPEMTREYGRLAALFRVEFASFERKRYDNLSHASNKAMNLNSYIGLMGKSFVEATDAGSGELVLKEVAAGSGTLTIPAAELLLTLDADSVLLPDYALRLSHLMQQPGNERLAVVQTPYSAFPDAPGVLERVADATTDIQYLVHQGFTRYDATFWVGANALLRRSALEDICTVHMERGHPVRKYIQDRTVIEDTESSIDLADCGWGLHNYPERLAYSATPPDFGSLLIQRRRWANGGLIILPKALRYLRRGPAGWRKAAEALCRVHYLSAIAVANVAMLLVLFGWFERNATIIWLFLCSLPYMILYARDLILCGYRPGDFLRVYALNLLLIPVHLGGAIKSLHQAATGKHAAFGRTPKVTGRTAAAGGYVLAEYALCAGAAITVGINLMNRHFMSAGFAATYVVAYAYAILHYIGVRESLADLRFWLRPTAQPAPALRDNPPSELPALPSEFPSAIPIRPAVAHRALIGHDTQATARPRSRRTAPRKSERFAAGLRMRDGRRVHAERVGGKTVH